VRLVWERVVRIGFSLHFISIVISWHWTRANSAQQKEFYDDEILSVNMLASLKAVKRCCRACWMMLWRSWGRKSQFCLRNASSNKSRVLHSGSNIEVNRSFVASSKKLTVFLQASPHFSRLLVRVSTWASAHYWRRHMISWKSYPRPDYGPFSSYIARL
jgi:hypothetical protein